MAIQSSFYSETALNSRTFPSTKHIATKQHMAVWRQQVSDDVWVQMNISDYQLINNSCVLNQLLSQTLYKQLEVRVADESDELATSPSDIAIVAGIATEVEVVAGISDEVVEVATGNYTKWVVDTIEDLALIDINIQTQVTVSDINRGGEFTYDPILSAVNNGVTIFDGWVRQDNQPINVKWGGAVGDGIIDDTLAIQKCFNAMPDNSGLILNDGEFLIASKDPQSLGYNVGISTTCFFVRGKNNITIEGNVKIIVDDYITPIQFVDCSNITVKGINIVGYGQNNPAWDGLNSETSCHLLRFGGGTENSGGGLDDVNTNACLTVVVDDVRAEQSTRYGISFETCTNIIVSNSFSGNNDWSGVTLWSVDRAIIKNNTFRNMNDHGTGGNSYGVSCSRTQNTNYCSNIQILGNYVEDTKWEGIDTHGGINIVISDNIIYNGANGLQKRNASIAIVSNSSGEEPTNIVIDNNIIFNDEDNNEESFGVIVFGNASDYPCSEITVSNNNIYGHRKDGIRLSSVDNAIISDNIIHHNRRSGIYTSYVRNIKFSGNNLNDNGGHADNRNAGIYVSTATTTTDNVMIESNIFSNRDTSLQTRGIQIETAGVATNLIFRNNKYIGMTTDITNVDHIDDAINYDEYIPRAYTDALLVNGTPSSSLIYPDGKIEVVTDIGSYIRFPSGEMTFEHLKTQTLGAWAGSGVLFYNDRVTGLYPVPFVGIVYDDYQAQSNSRTQSLIAIKDGTVGLPTTWEYWLSSGESVSTGNRDIVIKARGRWK